MKERVDGTLSLQELAKAEKYLIQLAQTAVNATEIIKLSVKRPDTRDLRRINKINLLFRENGASEFIDRDADSRCS